MRIVQGFQKTRDVVRVRFFRVVWIFANRKDNVFVKDARGIDMSTENNNEHLNFNLLPPVEKSETDQGT